MLKIVSFLLVPILLLGAAWQYLHNNPSLYQYIPTVPFESGGEDQVKPGVVVEIVDLFTVPKTAKKASLINQVVPYPGSSQLLLFNDMRGSISIIEGERVRAEPILNVGQLFGAHFKSDALELGLISFAIHPEFLNSGEPGFGKIYTVHSESPSKVYMGSANPYFGLIEKEAHHLSIISEWETAHDPIFRVNPTSQRVVMVIEQPYYNHNIYRIAFNPTAQTSSEDFGLLYVGVGDGGQAARLDRAEQTLFGKILRIDPLGEGGPGYAIPPGNPFISSQTMRPEVWAYGFRNPQHFSWDQQTGQMYAADIGEDNIEEVNLVVRGENYGWSYFEGMYLVSGSAFEIVKKPILPLAFFPVQFPIAYYDHDIGRAIAGGFVYRGIDIPELQGKYVFGDISNGRLFYFDTHGVGLGNSAVLHELILVNNGKRVTVAKLVNATWRIGLRFAVDTQGELMILNKRDNVIRGLTTIN